MKTNSYRIQAQVLHFPTSRILWINTYFPSDPQTVLFDDSELLEVLCELTKLVETTDYSDIVRNGDLNWDPSWNTGFSTTRVMGGKMGHFETLCLKSMI